MGNDKKKIGLTVGIGLVVGTAAGVLAAKKGQEYLEGRSVKVLKSVKEQFSGEKNIEGSWIIGEKENVTYKGIEQVAYRGGLTCKEEDRKQQYEFLADPETGTVMTIYPI